MTVHCPRCGAGVRAADINLDAGWGKCSGCDDVFPLVDVLPGYAVATVVRPASARAAVERSADALLVDVPAEGMRAATVGMIAFAAVWLGFIAFWTTAALGAFGGGDVCFACFSIPFWLVGFGILARVAWKVWGTKAVRIGADGLRTHARCLAWSRTRRIDRDRVQSARLYVPAVKSDGPEPHGAEIVYRAGSFVLPADTAAEARWLVAEINDFLTPARGRA